MSDVGKWSTVASKNNKPAPNGWPENMAPSDVNDSARENMAAIKRMSLTLPYWSPGGVITYVDATTFTIADDDLDTNYAKYYTEGRRLRAEASDGSYIMAVVKSSSYESSISTITVMLDSSSSPIPSTVSDVKVGLAYTDLAGAAGPNMLGMILPYTAASTDELPFGFLRADGEPFDPLIYTALADLYDTGEVDESGNKVYKYGSVEKAGRTWVNTPKYFGSGTRVPNYLEAQWIGVDQNFVVPEGETGQVVGTGYYLQATVRQNGNNTMFNRWLVGGRSQNWNYEGAATISLNVADGNTVTFNRGVPDNRDYVGGAYIPDKVIDVVGQDEQLPYVLIAYGGYASSSLIQPDDLVARVLVDIQPELEKIKNDINQEFEDSFGKMDEQVDQAEAAAELAKEYADKAADVIVGKQEKIHSYSMTFLSTDWSAETKTATFPIASLKADDIVWVAPNSTKDDIEKWSSCGIYGKQQLAGSLILECEEIPDIITINVGVCPQ